MGAVGAAGVAVLRHVLATHKMITQMARKVAKMPACVVTAMAVADAVADCTRDVVAAKVAAVAEVAELMRGVEVKLRKSRARITRRVAPCA